MLDFKKALQSWKKSSIVPDIIIGLEVQRSVLILRSMQLTSFWLWFAPLHTGSCSWRTSMNETVENLFCFLIWVITWSHKSPSHRREAKMFVCHFCCESQALCQIEWHSLILHWKSTCTMCLIFSQLHVLIDLLVFKTPQHSQHFVLWQWIEEKKVRNFVLTRRMTRKSARCAPSPTYFSIPPVLDVSHLNWKVIIDCIQRRRFHAENQALSSITSNHSSEPSIRIPRFVLCSRISRRSYR